jgi:hypothetical protein
MLVNNDNNNGPATAVEQVKSWANFSDKAESASVQALKPRFQILKMTLDHMEDAKEQNLASRSLEYKLEKTFKRSWK